MGWRTQLRNGASLGIKAKGRDRPRFELDSSNLPTDPAPTPPPPPTAVSPRPSSAGTSDRREWLPETGRARSRLDLVTVGEGGSEAVEISHLTSDLWLKKISNLESRI